MAKAGKIDGHRSPVAQRLRRLRAVEGYETATAFANRLGISVPRYLNIEGGMPLSIEVAQRIVSVVPGCSLDWLYNNVENGLAVDLRRRLYALDVATAKTRTGRASSGRSSA